MKMKYESPELEVYVFNAQDAIMDTDGCDAFNGGQCIADGVCFVDGGGGGCWDIHISGF